MLCRYYQAYLSAFRMWWLTSRFMTYQSTNASNAIL